jgi:hypothetical protein
MAPQIEEARKRIAECRERGDGVLDLGDLGLDDAALNKLLPDLLSLPPLNALNFGPAGATSSQSIDLTLGSKKPENNSLETIPGALLVAHPQLTFLNLSLNNLQALPDAIGGLAALEGCF